MKLKPILDRIIVKQDQPDTESEGGIYLGEPDYKAKGTVVAVGPLVSDNVRPGDHIFFGKYSNAPTDITGEDLLVMKEMDVMIVLQSAA